MKNYSALKKVTESAWEKIVTETNRVTEEVTPVTFTEGLLRPILKLDPDQQLELVEGLISGKYTKKTFNKRAEALQQQNKDIEFATDQLRDVVADDIYQSVIAEIKTGKYNLALLIQSAIARN